MNAAVPLIANVDGRRIEVKRPTRKPRHAKELMSKHLLHEIEAFGALFPLLTIHGRSDLRDFPPRSEKWWIGNSLVDAFLIHVRILDEFLHADLIAADKGRPQPIEIEYDACALDFVADPQAWLNERPPRSDSLRWPRISKTVAHLSWGRVEAGWESPDLSEKHAAHQKAQEWPITEIWDALRVPLTIFLEHVDAAAVCDEFGLWAGQALETKAIDFET